MEITSMIFLLIFLPISLFIYYFVNDKSKESVLLLLSLFFYAVGSVSYFLLFLIAIILTISIARCMKNAMNIWFKRMLLVLGILLNTGLLGYYKYANFMLSSLSNLFGGSFRIDNLILPLGISFFTFKAISYLADVYLGKTVLNSNPIHDALYLSIFSQLQAGPLTRYNGFNVSKKLEEKGIDFQLFYDGIFRFMSGFIKKVLLANTLSNIVEEVFSHTYNSSFSSSYVWLGSICYSMQIFFDFSGYSDMAIGLTEMFGYKCIENFNYPYMTESVSKFWRRWHISLSQWFRDYIYIPLGGSHSKNKLKVYFNLFVVWILTGLWHGAAWNFIVWGLGYFIMIVYERVTDIPNIFKTIKAKILYRVCTLLFINLQWVIFRSNSLSEGFLFIRRMFSFESDSLLDYRTRFLINDYFVFIFASILLCFPILPWFKEKAKKNKYTNCLVEILSPIVIVFLFIWAISFVVSGLNNPFIYANF
jgi:alginate O-acetyltransferase complex protein AlgI